jgi:hypothetical protein
MAAQQMNKRTKNKSNPYQSLFGQSRAGAAERRHVMRPLMALGH